MVVIAYRWLDDLRQLCVDGSIRQVVQRLINDPSRLPHLFESDQVAIVGVAVLSKRNVEIHVGICGIWTRLAHIPRYAGTAQRRAGKTDGNGFFTRDDSDSHRATQPDAVLRKDCFILIKPLGEVADKTSDVGAKVVIGVIRHPANSPGVTRETRAKLSFKDFQNLFALAQRPEKNCDGAN